MRSGTAPEVDTLSAMVLSPECRVGVQGNSCSTMVAAAFKSCRSAESMALKVEALCKSERSLLSTVSDVIRRLSNTAGRMPRGTMAQELSLFAVSQPLLEE